MPEANQVPRSARDEIEGLLYFPRLCNKVRLMQTGELREDFHGNLGLGMDQWICQFLGVAYQDLRSQIEAGASDEEALAWARKNGVKREDFILDWFNSYLRNRGFRDDMSGRLAERKAETPETDREDILSFMDYIEVDEGRTL